MQTDPKRSLLEKSIDRGLATYFVASVIINLFNLYQLYDIAALEEIINLGGMSLVIAILAPLLWFGSYPALTVIRLFYILQIPGTLAVKTFFYHFDGGLNLSLGYINSAIRFNFFFFKPTISVGFLNPNVDGEVWGVLINVLALALAIYYHFRVRKADLLA